MKMLFYTIKGFIESIIAAAVIIVALPFMCLFSILRSFYYIGKGEENPYLF